MLKIIILCITVTISIYSSWSLGIIITKKYFFDRVYYGKSHEYGYLRGSDYQNYELLTKRVNGFQIIPYAEHEPTGQIANNDYTIAVIGDSMVWGEGLTASDRFAERLAKKLNAIRPTSVYSFALPGDNFVDNLSKFFLIQKKYQMDLYIFILVFNDILVQENERYPSVDARSLRKECETKAYIYDGVYPSWEEYVHEIKKAWQNESNLCILTKGSSYLPKNALYVIIDPGWEMSEMKDGYDTYIKILAEKQLSVDSITPTSSGVQQYEHYWKDPKKFFSVSSKEGHPSALANQMYADFLFYELTHNEAWRFGLSPGKLFHMR